MKQKAVIKHRDFVEPGVERLFTTSNSMRGLGAPLEKSTPWFCAVILLFLATTGYAQPALLSDSETVKAPLIEAPAETEAPAPVAIEALSESSAGISNEISSLRKALLERRTALAKSQERLAFAESRLQRLNAEFEGLQQHLETAGLDLTRDYANLLRSRLERLERQILAENLALSIKNQLEAARIEQFRLEEFDAVLPVDDTGNRLAKRRAELLTELSQAVAKHIETLNSYFQVVTTVQERIVEYQGLVRQRLFWLPSTDPVNGESFVQLLAATRWLLEPTHWAKLVASVPGALRTKPFFSGVLLAILVFLLVTRSRVKRRLVATGEYVGNVGHDRIGHTLAALGYSFVLTMSGVVSLSLAAVLVSSGNEFAAALSLGLGNAAFVFFLLGMVYQVARGDGIGERHFAWGSATLQAIRRGIPRLLLLIIPATIFTPITEAAIGQPYRDSLGRAIFAVGSIALALFAHRVLWASLTGVKNMRTARMLKTVYLIAVATPIVFMGFSLYGYHHTAVQLEGTLFITVCWVALVVLFFYLGLRALSVRERRLTLQRLREQRAAEQELAAAREAADASGEGLPVSLDLPEMDLHAINKQSHTLLRLVAGTVALFGVWALWANVFPAFRVLDEVTLWSVAAATAGGDAIPITLADLVLALLFALGTLLAARNLPGTLEVAVLSRMNLAPGTGYAITTMITYVIIIFGVVVSLGVIGAQWSKLQWLVAALGVGLGFGLQEIVANFVSGIIILFERPIRVGDTVTVGQKTGTVSRIRIRATTLVDWDRKEQIIPNKTFVTQDLTNWTLSDAITRVIIRVGVAYASDVDEVHDVLAEVVDSNKRVVKDPPPAVFCVGLADSSINFELRVFVKSMLDIMPLQHEMHASITKALQESGIEIPFPQRDIHVRTLDQETGFRVDPGV